MDTAYENECKNINEPIKLFMESQKSEHDPKNDFLAEKSLEPQQLEKISMINIEDVDEQLIPEKAEDLHDPEIMLSTEKEKTPLDFYMGPETCVDTSNVVTSEEIKLGSDGEANKLFWANESTEFAVFNTDFNLNNSIRQTDDTPSFENQSIVEVENNSTEDCFLSEDKKLTKFDASYENKDTTVIDNPNNEIVANSDEDISNKEAFENSEVKGFSDMTKFGEIEVTHEVNDRTENASDIIIKSEPMSDDKCSEKLLNQEISSVENKGKYTNMDELLPNELLNSQGCCVLPEEPVDEFFFNNKSVEESNIIKLCTVDHQETIHEDMSEEPDHILNKSLSTTNDLSNNVPLLDLKPNNFFEEIHEHIKPENVKLINDDKALLNQELLTEQTILEEKEVLVETEKECMSPNKMSQERANDLESVQQIALVSNVTPEINDIHTNTQQNSDEKEIKETKVQENILESGEDSEDEWKYLKPKNDEKTGIMKNEPILNEEIAIEYSDKIIGNDEISKVTIESQEPEKALESQNKKEYSDSLDKEVEDMTTSQLNPEAKEFVPTSPPLLFDVSHGAALTAAVHCLNADDVVAQSPRKGTFSMEDISVPNENEFDREILYRPSEINDECDDTYIKTQTYENNSCPKSIVEEEHDKDQSVILDGTQNSNLEVKEMKIENVFGKTADLLNSVQTICFDTDVKDINSSTNDKYIDLGMGESIKNSEISPLNKVEAVGNETSDEISPLSESSANEISDKRNMEINMPFSDLQSLTVGACQLDSKITLDENKTEEIGLPSGEDFSITKVESSVEEMKLIDLVPSETKLVNENLEQSADLKEEETEKQEVCMKPEAKPKTVSSSAKRSGASNTISSINTKAKSAVGNLKTKSVTSSRPKTAPAISKMASPSEKKVLTKPKNDLKSSTAVTSAAKKTTLLKTKPADFTKTAVPKTTTNKISTNPPRQITSSKSLATVGMQSKTRPVTSANIATSKNISENSLSPNSKSLTLSSNANKKSISPRATLTSALRKTEAVKNPVSNVAKAPPSKQVASRLLTTNKTTVTPSQVGTNAKSAPSTMTVTRKVVTSTIQKKSSQKQVNTVTTGSNTSKVKDANTVGNYVNDLQMNGNKKEPNSN